MRWCARLSLLVRRNACRAVRQVRMRGAGAPSWGALHHDAMIEGLQRGPSEAPGNRRKTRPGNADSALS